MIPGIYSVVLFSLAFLAPVACRYLGPKRLLVVTTGGLALVRLAEQSVTSPPVDLALATLGTLLFLWTMPTYVGILRGRGQKGSRILIVAVLLGVALDTTIKGAFGTLDLSWQPGTVTHFVVAVLVVTQLLLKWRTVEGLGHGMRDAPGYRDAAALVSLGPIIFLELLLFQNVGQQTAFTEWSQPAVFLLITASNVIGLLAALAVIAKPDYGVRASLGGLAALLVVLVLGERTGWAAAMVVLLGQITLPMAVGVIGASIGVRASNSGIARTAAITGLGMLEFLVLAFLYYGNYQLDFPGGTRLVPPLATALVLASILPSLPQLSRYRPQRLNLAPVAGLLLLLVAPVGYLAGWEEPEPLEPDRLPISVMTYNLHQGFDTRGVLAIED